MSSAKKPKSNIVAAVSSMTHIGITIASCIIVGVLIGRTLDRVIGTSPWLLVIFSLLGVVAAFRAIMKTQISIAMPDDSKETETETETETKETD